MVTRKTFGEVRVGDGIRTHPSHPDMSNGRLWSGEVTAVEDVGGGRVGLTVAVDGRSLCADDLVRGFPTGGVTYLVNGLKDAPLVRPARWKGRRLFMSGYVVEGGGLA